jgi:hypothetical protein
MSHSKEGNCVDNKVSTIFGHKTDEEKLWRKLHDGELHD